MIRTGTTMDNGARRNAGKVDLFSDNFASNDDFGFDDNNPDGDLSWANDDPFAAKASSTHSLSAKLTKIKPKKINDDDQTWFSEASDFEGGPTNSSRHMAQKKRRKAKGADNNNNNNNQGKLTATATRGGTKKKIPVHLPHKCDDTFLLQHPNSRAGETTDDDSSVEENLFQFSATFDAFGTQQTNNQQQEEGLMNNQSAAVAAVMDNSTNHSSTPFFASSETGPPSAMHSSVSTSLSSVSASSMPTSCSTLPLPQSPTGAEKALQATPPLEGDPYHSSQNNKDASKKGHLNNIENMSLEQGSNHEAWLGAVNMIRKTSSRHLKSGDRSVNSCDLSSANEDAASTGTSPSRKDKKAITSLAAAAALMNKPASAQDTLDPVSVHSVESADNNSSLIPVEKMGSLYLQAGKRVDPLSASDHGPRRHSRTGAANAGAAASKQRKVQRQNSTGCVKMEEFNTSQNASALLNASGSLHASGSLQTSESLPTSSGPLHASGSLQASGSFNASGSLQQGNRPRRKVVRKSPKAGATPSSEEGGQPSRRRVPARNNSVSGSSDDGLPFTSGIARRRVKPSSNAMSGSSDDGAPQGNGIARRRTLNNGLSGSSDDGAPQGNGIARRRTLNNGINSGNDSNGDLGLSESQHGGPGKKKVIRRRASDGGGADNAVMAGKVRRKIPVSKAKGPSPELAAVSQVTAAKQNMAKMHAEIQQGKGPQRRLKPGVAQSTVGGPKAKTSPLDAAMEKSNAGPRRMLQKLNSVRSMPVQGSRANFDGFPAKNLFDNAMDDMNVQSSDEMVVRKRPTRASATAIETGAHSSDEMVARQRPIGRASTTALDRHMTKRRPKKAGGPSGSASLAGHEFQHAKKTMTQKSDLSLLPGGKGQSGRISGAASVGGDQVARRVPGSTGNQTGRRPVAKRPVQPRPKKMESS